MDSAYAIGDGRVMMGTQSVPAASGTYPLLDFGGIPGLFSDMPNGATEYANALLDPEDDGGAGGVHAAGRLQGARRRDQPRQQRAVGQQADQARSPTSRA